eukprot:SAG31_NODE_12162_length_963_cov_0.966435_1_plen_35_part_10
MLVLVHDVVIVGVAQQIDHIRVRTCCRTSISNHSK